MKAYAAIFKGRLLSLFQYRLAAIAGIGTQIFWGIIKMMIFQAFYVTTSALQPITLSQAFTFIWIGQTLLQLLPWSIDKEIEGQIKSGHVAYELARPLDLYWYWFTRSMAFRCIPTLLRSIPLVLVAFFIFDMPLPASVNSGALFFISLLFSILLSTAMTTVIVISLFWTISGEGIQRLLPHVTMILSGMMVPLPLFPNWMQPFLSIQPFRGIIDIPVRLYSGIIPISNASYYLAFQFAWFLIFVLIGKYLMHKAMKRITIQGG